MFLMSALTNTTVTVGGNSPVFILLADVQLARRIRGERA
jgi:hypothetical protein